MPGHAFQPLSSTHQDPPAPQGAPSLASPARRPVGVSSEPHVQGDRPYVTAHLFTGCLHPSRPGRLALHGTDTQSTAWHRAGAQQTSVGGMTLHGETKKHSVPKMHRHLLLLVLAQWWQGTRAVGGGRGRADPPPLSGLAGPELVKTRQDRPRPCEVPGKTSRPQRPPRDTAWGPGGARPAARQASRGRKCPGVSLGPPWTEVYFRPEPKIHVAGHTNVHPPRHSWEGPHLP